MNNTNDTAELSRNHEVRVSAMMKVLTTQRDSANNATVNALAEKAVLEEQLKRVNNKLIATENTLAGAEAELSKARSEISASRIVILNLESQLNDKANAETQPEEPDEKTKPTLVERLISCVPNRS